MPRMTSILFLVLLGASAAVRTANSPVSKVVQLLKGLSGKVEDTMRTEGDMFKKFDCWSKNVIKTKSLSNTKAGERIKELKSYISDIESGKIEFTSERSDLEADLKELNTAIYDAEAEYDQKTNDFNAAEKQMNQALDALEWSLDVLGDKAPAKFLQMGTADQDADFAGGQALERAVAIGHRVLSHSDALFLQRVLTGDVPKKDYKKLNRKAAFKSKYKARSGEIQKILEKIKKDFEDGLEHETKSQKERTEEHEDLMKNKKEQRDELKQALNDASGEKAAREKEKNGAQDEIDDLEEQVKNDKKYIEETEKALEDKTKQYNARVKIQRGEVEAIGKAISILHSDDARELFKSAGTFLLQKTVRSNSKFALGTVKQSKWFAQRIAAAVRVIENGAKKEDARHMMTLASLLRSKQDPVSNEEADDGMNAVTKAIDELIDKLVKDQEDDDAMKTRCTEDHSRLTKETYDKAVEIDEHTKDINTLQDEINTLNKEMDDNNKDIDDFNKALDEATANRKKENEEFEKAKSDDEAAKTLVENAKKEMDDYYKNVDSAGTSLAQRSKQPKAGEDPGEAPKTWDDSYEGEQDAATGIIGIMETIIKDLEDDIKDAEKEEEDAVKDFNDFKKDTQDSIKDLDDSNTQKTDSVGDKQGDKSTLEDERLQLNSEWQAKVDEIHEMTPECNFLMVAYEERQENRKTEKKSLEKAKDIVKEAVKETSS